MRSRKEGEEGRRGRREKREGEEYRGKETQVEKIGIKLETFQATHTCVISSCCVQCYASV